MNWILFLRENQIIQTGQRSGKAANSAAIGCEQFVSRGGVFLFRVSRVEWQARVVGLHSVMKTDAGGVQKKKTVSSFYRRQGFRCKLIEG